MREGNDSTAVYTDIISSEVETRDIAAPVHTFGIVEQNQGEYQKDAALAMVFDRVYMLVEKTCECDTKSSPGVRCVHPRRYYYLLGDHVYTCLPVREQDFATTPPTIYERTTLELVDEPGSIRDRLLSTPPTPRGMLF